MQRLRLSLLAMVVHTCSASLGRQRKEDLQFQGQCGLYSETLSHNKTNLGHPFMELRIVLNLDIGLPLCPYPLFFLNPPPTPLNSFL
ncbi:hypothetical protein I79_010467 [Cricetulus griseus]|uniref:Secreted protein n=1 Tax=Cricetulus griseus TaxID=10029 RepID=G3HIJ6_CRIGR|nr:hypothetical protein I79_010467 [Cricetulus griseus]